MNALVPIEVAKKLLAGPNFPLVKVLGSIVKQNLAVQFKRWSLIVEVPKDQGWCTPCSDLIIDLTRIA